MRRRTTFRTSHFLVGVVIVSIMFILMINLFLGTKRTYDYEVFISAENTTHVQVVSDSADINVSMYEGDEIRAYLVDDKGERLLSGFRLKVKEKDGKALIQAKRKFKHAQRYALLVELPSKQYERIEVQADSANIFVGALHTTGYVLRTSVGNIDVESGQGIINADTRVGNIHISMLSIVRDIIAETEVGNIIVETNEAPGALQTVCTTSIGEVSISLPNVHNGSIGSEGPLVKLISEVGDVSLKLIGE